MPSSTDQLTPSDYEIVCSKSDCSKIVSRNRYGEPNRYCDKCTRPDQTNRYSDLPDIHALFQNMPNPTPEEQKRGLAKAKAALAHLQGKSND